MIKKGTVSIVDRYKGSQLIEKVYKGSDLIFDAFSEITGNLPLSFNARAQHALKNYRLYGTAAGAGVKTEQLFDKNAKDENNGFVLGAYILRSGNLSNNINYNVSEYIPIQAGVQYCLYWAYASSTQPAVVFYDSDKQYLSGKTYGSTSSYVFTPEVDGYLRFSYRINFASETSLTEGSEPATELIYGYKIPLSISDGTNTSNYNLFIGSTKLGEEEYADFGEQKVYKRTEQLFNKNAEDVANGYVSAHLLQNNGNELSSSQFDISEYIKVEPNTNYYLLWMYVGNSTAYCLYDSNKQYLTGGKYINYGEGLTGGIVTTTSTTSYIRFTIRKALADSIMLVEGSTAPASYIPYFQPTDPPVPLPAIIAYKGENTLSSTETVGNVTVKGRISEISPTP